jgi:hypothetical protein
MRPVRLSRRTAIVGLTIYDVGQILDALSSLPDEGGSDLGDDLASTFAADRRALYDKMVALIDGMSRVGDRIDAGVPIHEARLR